MISRAPRPRPWCRDDTPRAWCAPGAPMRAAGMSMFSGCCPKAAKSGRCASTRAAAQKFPENAMRVLVVEDEAALREALKADLTAAGHTVDVAADGEEGLYAATEYPIDVAIIDLGLPKLSGLELIRQLRARGKSYGVLILTARDRWQDKVEGLSAGADDYVAKPFHVAEVQARLGQSAAGLRPGRTRLTRTDRHGAR